VVTPGLADVALSPSPATTVLSKEFVAATSSTEHHSKPFAIQAKGFGYAATIEGRNEK
jgi:hypothetical protein